MSVAASEADADVRPGSAADDDLGDPNSSPPTRGPAVGRLEVGLLIAGFIALAVAVIGTRWGEFTPDTRPDLYEQPGRFLNDTLQAWVGGATGLGQGNFNAGAAPVAVVVWVIRTLGAPAWLAVRIWRVLLLVVAAWGIRRYLGAVLGDRLTVTARLVVTVFWVANPYVIVAGNTTPILLPYALLPWTMLAFVRAIREPRSWRWPAAFALAFFAQTGLNAGVIPFFQLLALPGHLLWARWVEQRRIRDLLGTVVRCGVLSVVVSLYWLAPAFLATGTGASIAGTTEDPVDVARTSSYAETSRLLGAWPLYGRSGDRLFLGGYTAYLTNPFAVAASFLVPVAVGLALWRSRSRERLLVVGLLAVALPTMVGLFPSDSPYAAGRLLLRIFESVPASLAFRTTNKVGAVVVLAYALALAIGVGSWQRATHHSTTLVRRSGLAVATVALLGASMPMWNGSLYPLGYEVPATWHQATADLDDHPERGRVLVVPGGTGGNYRWGMRSPDDLFPSHLQRDAVSRNVVVGRGDPSGNLLSWFDTALQQGVLTPTGTSTMARYLGAGDVVVRNDVLTEETAGARPSVISEAVGADPGLKPERTYGRPGADTVPESSGVPSDDLRKLNPADAKLHPVETHRVRDPAAAVSVAGAEDLVIIDGDGEAVGFLAGLGILDGTQPFRYLGDLDAGELATSVDAGARLVLTDTNRRRAWDTNRLIGATSPTLTVGEDIDSGSGATVTLWPDDPDRQTVATYEGIASISTDIEGFGIQPFGKAALALDGDPTTGWSNGGFHGAEGGQIVIRLHSAQTVRSVSVKPSNTEPSAVESVSVQVGSQVGDAEMLGGEEVVRVPIRPTVADTITLTITGQSAGANPVGIKEIIVNEGEVLADEVIRMPRTLANMMGRPASGGSSGSMSETLASVPLDVVMTRQQGQAGRRDDDEEYQIVRSFDLPMARRFTFAATLSSSDVDPDLIRAVRDGGTDCMVMASLDGTDVAARITSTPEQLDEGQVHLTGCDEVDLAAGTHRFETIFGWRLNQVHLSSADDHDDDDDTRSAAEVLDGPGEVVVTDASPTRMEMDLPAGTGLRFVRLGEAFDPRWTLEVDGVDYGPPILIDGYSVGWLVDSEAHQLVASFPAQGAVRTTLAISAVSVAGVVAVAVLPAPVLWTRRRRRSTPDRWWEEV